MWRGGEVLSVWSKGEGKLMSSVQKSVEGYLSCVFGHRVDSL